LEKDKILLTLVDKVKEDEATFKTQAEAQKLKKNAYLKRRNENLAINGQIIWKETLKSFGHPRKGAMTNLKNVLRK
jgi:FtsZ-binding cell division protein ZapB